MLLAVGREFRGLGRVEAARRRGRNLAEVRRAGAEAWRNRATTCPARSAACAKFYAPLLEAKYDNVEPRLRDLEQLELIASRYRSRRRMLLEMTLDPPVRPKTWPARRRWTTIIWS